MSIRTNVDDDLASFAEALNQVDMNRGITGISSVCPQADSNCRPCLRRANHSPLME